MHEWHVTQSRMACWLLALGSAAALAALWLAGPQHAWQWLLIALIIFVCAQDLARARHNPVQRIMWRGGQWYVMVAGRVEAADPIRVHFIGQRFGVIHFAGVSGDKYTLALLPDSLSCNDFRQLAVVLR